MRPRSEIVGNPRVRKLPSSPFGMEMVELNGKTGRMHVAFSADEDGWEHVSVSPIGSKYESKAPCPTWRQMSEVRDVFWAPDELVLQLHPPEAEYFHGPGFDTNILHLWRPVGGDWSKLGEKEA